jgi:cobyrinic acid a,c-diamide synthase
MTPYIFHILGTPTKHPVHNVQLPNVQDTEVQDTKRPYPNIKLAHNQVFNFYYRHWTFCASDVL